jgi:hypothetical protein
MGSGSSGTARKNPVPRRGGRLPPGTAARGSDVIPGAAIPDSLRPPVRDESPLDPSSADRSLRAALAPDGPPVPPSLAALPELPVPPELTPPVSDGPVRRAALSPAFAVTAGARSGSLLSPGTASLLPRRHTLPSVTGSAGSGSGGRVSVPQLGQRSGGSLPSSSSGYAHLRQRSMGDSAARISPRGLRERPCGGRRSV